MVGSGRFRWTSRTSVPLAFGRERHLHGARPRRDRCTTELPAPGEHDGGSAASPRRRSPRRRLGRSCRPRSCRRASPRCRPWNRANGRAFSGSMKYVNTTSGGAAIVICWSMTAVSIGCGPPGWFGRIGLFGAVAWPRAMVELHCLAESGKADAPEVVKKPEQVLEDLRLADGRGAWCPRGAGSRARPRGARARVVRRPVARCRSARRCHPADRSSSRTSRRISRRCGFGDRVKDGIHVMMYVNSYVSVK